MAVTKIHAIKKTLGKALAYIETPSKTAEQLYLTGYGTDPHTATLEFEMTNKLAKEKKGNFDKVGGGNNLAYHMIQSFSPHDKITAKKAHQIGRQWADEVLKGKHQYVLSTHLDKGHIHNHVIFNATSFRDFSKFRSIPHKTAQHLRDVSDKLCQINDLNVIKYPRNIGKGYHELQHAKHATSWKAQIAERIDEAISQATSYPEFKKYLTEAGVEIKEGKRISFRLKETKQTRFCRGDRISPEYSRAGIEQRLKMTRELGSNPTYFKQLNWRAKQLGIPNNNPNLINAIATIKRENITSEKNLRQTIANLQAHTTKLNTQILELNAQIRRNQLISQQRFIYEKNKPIFDELQQKNFLTRKRFAQKHQQALTAYHEAQESLAKLNFANRNEEKITVTHHQHSASNHRLLVLSHALDVVDAVMSGNAQDIETVIMRELEFGLKQGLKLVR
jgi:hypothetical protein